MKMNFTVLVVIISIYEIYGMTKRKQKGELLIFVVIAALSLIFGYYYISNPYKESLAQHILKLYGKEY